MICMVKTNRGEGRGQSSEPRRILDKLTPVAATWAKVNFGDILHRASVDGERFLVNRSGRAVAVVLGYREYMELQKKK